MCVEGLDYQSGVRVFIRVLARGGWTELRRTPWYCMIEQDNSILQISDLLVIVNTIIPLFDQQEDVLSSIQPQHTLDSMISLLCFLSS